MTFEKDPIIGQEATCLDGLGRVIGFQLKDSNPAFNYIQIHTYIKDTKCKWNPRLIRLNYEDEECRVTGNFIVKVKEHTNDT